ncbi:unnamed protein product [Boreogadus saida]
MLQYCVVDVESPGRTGETPGLAVLILYDAEDVNPTAPTYLTIYYIIMIFSVISAAWSVGGDVAEPLNQALSV